jgi:UDP-galactopyranose mutase
MKRYDYLILGSGLLGATFAYLAHQAGHRCLVTEKHPHTGGSAYCANIDCSRAANEQFPI